MGHPLYTAPDYLGSRRRPLTSIRDVVMSVLFVFFFQAEDGIRDTSVTGVQTCALPILDVGAKRDSAAQHPPARVAGAQVVERQLEHLRDLGGRRRPRVAGLDQADERIDRSEERRVGKECRTGRWPYHKKRRRYEGTGND